jgi:exonuclease SbcD
MKIMHLSDLHLGKNILEQSMIEDQRYIIDRIIDVVKNREIDIVMIAGDVYDRGIPSVEAVNLFSEFLTRLYKLGIKVLIISGNHDSKDRLTFGNELFVDNGIYIEGIFNGKLRKEEFSDSYGKLNIYMLPFVKPADVRRYYSNVEINSYNDAVKCIIDNTGIDINERNVIMIHQFVTASGVEVERSDSESISLGGIDNIDVSIFDKFDYVAMGHIHGAQKLIRDTVRYSGSPLKYSFSEANQKKSVSVIEFKNKDNVKIDLVELKPIRDMRVIKGPIDKLLDKNIYSLGNKDDYINAIITDDDYVVDAIGKLRKVYKNILKLEYKNNRTINTDCVSGNNFDVKDKSSLELFRDFYRGQNNIELDKNREKIVSKIIKEVLDETN